MRNEFQLAILMATLFLAMLGFGVTLPALPFFVERMALGIDPSKARLAFHVGLLTSAYALGQLFLGPLFGAWSDRVGRRPVLVVGLLGYAISQAVFGLGTTLPVLYAARVAGGVAASALLTTSSAAVADLLTGTRRVRGMAWRGTASSLGLALGPAMSGLLTRTDMHGHRMIGRLMLDGFSIPFLAAAALALAAVLLVIALPGGRPSAPLIRHRQPSMGKLTDLLLLSVVAQLSLAAFEAIFALYGRDELALSIVDIGWAFVACGLGMAVFQGVLALSVAGRVRRQVQLTFGFTALATGTGLLGLTATFPAALGAITVLSLGIGVITPNLAAAVADRCPEASGTALGLQGTALGVGQVAGPVVGSILYAARPTVPFVATAFTAALAAVWLGVRGKRV